MKSLDVLRKLLEINKPFYTIADMEKITGFLRNTLYVALKRWVDMKIVERIGKGLYVPFGKEINIELIASQLYIPNYLSFESALSRYGVLNLIPYTVTYATPRKTKHYSLAGRDIEFRQIKRELFFGFTKAKEGYIAEKEKAFLDQLYFVKKGIVSFDFDEVDLSTLSRRKLYRYAKQYPQCVISFLKELGI